MTIHGSVLNVKDMSKNAKGHKRLPAFAILNELLKSCQHKSKEMSFKTLLQKLNCNTAEIPTAEDPSNDSTFFLLLLLLLLLLLIFGFLFFPMSRLYFCGS